jgi:predicted dehydrogenase
MIQIFLAGAGAIARFHAAAALSSDAVVSLHVADPSARALSSFCEEFPMCIAHESVTEMFAVPHSATDIAVIATPPFTHRDLVIEALRAGLNVLCEKPLAMTTAEGREMADLARELGLILDSCDSRFRRMPATQVVRSLVEAKALGTPYHVTFRNKSHRSRSGFDFQSDSSWFRDPLLSGGGVSMDWGPYDIAVLDETLAPVRVDILHAWFGYPRTDGPFASESTNAEQHIGAAMNLTLADGTVVAVSYERAACTEGEEQALVEIEGTEAAVSWDWLDWVGNNEVRVTRDVGGNAITERDVLAGPPVEFHHRPLRELISALSEGPSVAAMTQQTIFTFDWLRAIVSSAVDGRPTSVSRLRETQSSIR